MTANSTGQSRCRFRSLAGSAACCTYGGGPATAERAAATLLAQTGAELFGRVRSAPDPERCSFEISVGENATQLNPDEVVDTLRQLLDLAGASLPY